MGYVGFAVSVVLDMAEKIQIGKEGTQMSNYYAEDVEYLLLQAVSEHQEPVGAGFLAETFADREDLALSEATIGRHLRRLEQKGYLCCEQYNGRSRGRIITQKGVARIQELAVGRKQIKAVTDVMKVLRDGNERQLRNMLVTREIIEPEVAALAAKNATEENIQAIHEVVDRMVRLTEMGRSMAATDGPFHVEIAKASGNTVLEMVVRMIRTDRDYSPEIECIINASSAEKPNDHWNIYRAIAEHDEEKARQLMKQHIRNIINMIDAYEKSQL